MTSRDSSPGVAVGFALLMVLSVALSTVGFAGAAAAQSQQADVVFVWDVSGSMDDEADDLISETKTLASELDSSGVDAQFGVVFMDKNFNGPSVEQDLTSDTTKIDSALEGVESNYGNETASEGILTALNDISYREGSRKVIVVFTDCQDLNGADTRDTAISELNKANAYLVSVSPDENEYNCPGADDPTGVDKEDELKYLAEERADNGIWSDIDIPFKDVVKDIIGAVQQATGGDSEEEDPTISDVEVSAEADGSGDAS